MKKISSFHLLGLAMLAICFSFPPTMANATNLLDMADQLDKLDQQDFQELLDKADDCTLVRDFACTDAQLRKASKLANGSKDRLALNRATQNMQAEKQRVQAEALARAEEERQIRLAEERREEAEREEVEREEERIRMAQRETEESSSTPNYGQAFLQGINEVINQQNKLTEIHNDTMQDLSRMIEARQAREEAARRANERAADQRARENERSRQQTLARQQDQQEQIRQQEISRRQEQARKEEQARKKAEDAIAKMAEQQARKQAEEQYLARVAEGTQLAATKCPDGEGKYYATGTRPNIKPEVVSCVDVHFKAYCPGSTQYSSGIARNFIGMAGCFGDTYDIDPKPACKVDQVRIDVVKVVPGCL